MSKVTNVNPNYKETVDIESEELVIGKLIMTKSRRQVKVEVRKMVSQAIQTCY